MAEFIIGIFHIVLVLAIMTGMVVALVSLHHFMTDRRSLDDKDRDTFRRQIEEEDYVISEHSIFYHFFERNTTEESDESKPFRSLKR